MTSARDPSIAPSTRSFAKPEAEALRIISGTTFQARAPRDIIRTSITEQASLGGQGASTTGIRDTSIRARDNRLRDVNPPPFYKLVFPRSF